jgi:hypothetical protein
MLQSQNLTAFLNHTKAPPDSEPNYYSYFSDTVLNSTSDAARMFASAIANNLTRLEPADCISAYAEAPFQTSHGSLILVTSNTSFTTQAFQFSNSQVEGPQGPTCQIDPFGWICSNLQQYICPTYTFTVLCSPERVNSSNWQPFGNKVDYCLSEVLSDRCRVQFVPPLAYIVMCFNFLKASILLFVFFVEKDNPIMTIGDAVASFLTQRDKSTRDFCFLEKQSIHLWEAREGYLPYPLHPKFLNFQYTKWSSVVSTRRWTMVWTFYNVILFFCISLFIAALVTPGISTNTLMTLGFGAANPITFIQGWIILQGLPGLISNAIVANLAQPILSTIYYMYNGIFTCFLLGVEWNNFASHRKGLRVSVTPQGVQRSSYALQLPKTWAIPLLLLSGLLHWLCSQSIFLVSVDIDSSRLVSGTDSPAIGEFLTCGFSPAAILSTILVGIAMFAFLIISGRRRFRNNGMTVVSSCSAAISAACHPPSEEPAAGIHGQHSEETTGRPSARSFGGGVKVTALRHSESTQALLPEEDHLKDTHDSEEGIPVPLANLPLQWGVTGKEILMDLTQWRQNANNSYGELMFGHCAFSSTEVSPPRPDIVYAGLETSTRKEHIE